jgi:hypothetical protein
MSILIILVIDVLVFTGLGMLTHPVYFIAGEMSFRFIEYLAIIVLLTVLATKKQKADESSNSEDSRSRSATNMSSHKEGRTNTFSSKNDSANLTLDVEETTIVTTPSQA